MARQSLSPMKDLGFQNNSASEPVADRVGRKRKDAPMTHLKYLRKRSGYTLEALSEITSISISYLSRLESGSRRLNTDLIRRLSHAFGCDPAELLQEVSHDGRVITPVEFSKRKRVEPINKDTSMPLYYIAADPNDANSLSIKICSPNEWRIRPSELGSAKEVFAIKAESYFLPHFSQTSTIYLEPSNNLSPESTVVILSQGHVMIKKIWSITPTSVQLCDIRDMEALKNGSALSDKLITLDRTTLEAVYKVVGYSDFNIL